MVLNSDFRKRRCFSLISEVLKASIIFLLLVVSIVVNIIMLTTENDPRMKNRGKAAGVKGWIVKPFNGPAVLPGFKKLLS